MPPLPFQHHSHPNMINQNRLNILHGGTIASMVDLGGSLAVASRGLFATGVSTDLNGMHIVISEPVLLKQGSADTCDNSHLPKLWR